MNEEITVLDLFSGIGGFSLGLERAGPFRTVAFCEQDAYAQRVLKKHWPEVPIFEDVRTIPTDGLGRIDLICGGFPCQPWSVAGQQRGAEDDRDLWPAMVALIEDLRPQWVIGENVRGFVSQPMGLQRSLSDLARIGYEAVPFIIPACAVDAPHRRDRVWIVANAQRERGPGRTLRAGDKLQTSTGGAADTFSTGSTRPKIVADPERTGTRVEKHRSSGQKRQSSDTPQSKVLRQEDGTDRSKGTTADSRNVADAKELRLEGIWDIEEGDTERSSQEQSMGQGWGTHRGWLPEPNVGRVADGFSRWMDEPDIPRVATGIENRVARLKCLGNAVVPQVVEQIGRAILEGWQR